MQHIIVSFGGGTNSSAMLIGMSERGIRPSAITFADTGGEKPETYAHIEEMQRWLSNVGFPPITILRGRPWWTPQMVKDGSLERMSLRLGTLPSKAYGNSTCSLKWKVEPQNKFDTWYAKTNSLSALRQITRYVGFDAGEPSRVERGRRRHTERMTKKDFPQEEYPLVEWGWTREDCVAAIDRAGVRRPGKSACFFCPSMKKHEILELQKVHPTLYARAVEMERKALSDEGEGQMGPTTCKGLGRSFSWAEFVESNPGQVTPFDSRYCDPACDTCFDGD